MFYVSESFIILIAILVIILSITISSIILLIIVRPMKNKMDEQSRVLFSILKKHVINNDELHMLKESNSNILMNIKSLSTSIGLVLEEDKKRKSQKIYPTPNLSDMITLTINEQIAVETTLSKDMILPNKKSAQHIIEVVTQTYPHVDEEFLVKKSLALIEVYNRRNSKPDEG